MSSEGQAGIKTSRRHVSFGLIAPFRPYGRHFRPAPINRHQRTCLTSPAIASDLPRERFSPMTQNLPSPWWAFRNIQFGTKKACATAESLTPDAFGDPHFCPKQVCAGALSAGCQWRAMLRLANETRSCVDRWKHWL